MALSDEYLYGNFKTNYDEALKAKQYGNLATAKKKFEQAAFYLEQFSMRKSGAEAAELNSRAQRLKAIAAAITVTANNQTPVRQSAVPTVQHKDDDCATESQDVDTEGMEEYFTFYKADELEQGFEGVIGLESAKESVTEYVINPLRYGDYYNYKFNDNKAILLEGPPGTGKTTFAKAVAKEINQPFVLVNVAALVNCYVGETAKNIDKVFAALRSYSEKNKCGLTVFFDEFDEIAKQRGSDDKASASAVPALLRNMDGIKQNKSFLILANTNCMELLDVGILDRFRKRIHIPLPDKNMRLSFFKSKLAELEDEYKEKLDFEYLADMSDGLSGRSITYICDDFKYYVAGVKAGIKDGSDLNSVVTAYVSERLKSQKNDR
ncbi:MAG: ATP-binding protein [Clostridia bacterium]|nr:ATP-binding protein [Clostridia bacterium]